MGAESPAFRLTGPHSIGISCGTCKFPTGAGLLDRYSVKSMEIRVVRDSILRDELTEIA